MNKIKNHYIEIDAFRVLAILSVVAIHTTTRTLENASFNINSQILAFFINQVTRFAVPLFFLISGFVLEANFHNHSSTKAYIKKRFKRILIPYVFWSLIYYYFIYTAHTHSFLKALFIGNASYQLYFIPTLLVFYLTFPLLHKLRKTLAKHSVITLLFGIQLILLTFKYYIDPLSELNFWSVAALNFFVFIFGIIAADKGPQLVNILKKDGILLIAGTFLLAIFTFAEGKILYTETQNYLYFYGSFRPGVLIYTILLFTLLYVPLSKLIRFQKHIKKLSSLSFFIFFAHVITIEILGSNFIIVTITTYLAAYLVHKIPLLNRLTG